METDFLLGTTTLLPGLHVRLEIPLFTVIKIPNFQSRTATLSHDVTNESNSWHYLTLNYLHFHWSNPFITYQSYLSSGAGLAFSRSESSLRCCSLSIAVQLDQPWPISTVAHDQFAHSCTHALRAYNSLANPHPLGLKVAK